MPTRRDFLASAAALGPAAALGGPAPPGAPDASLLPAGPDGEPLLPAGVVRRLGSAKFRAGNGVFECTADGRYLVSTFRSRVDVLDAATGRHLRRFAFNTTGRVHVSTAGRLVTVRHAVPGGTYLSGHDLAGRPLFVSPPVEFGGRIKEQVFDPAGDRLFIAEEKRIAAFDVRTFGLLWAFEYPEQDTVTLAVRRDGKELLVRRAGIFLVLDPATGDILRRADLSGFAAAMSLSRLTLADDGQLAAFEIEDRGRRRDDSGPTLAVCRFDPGEVLWTATGLRNPFMFVGGSREVLADRDGRWQRLDARTGRRLGELGTGYLGYLGRTPDPNVVTFSCGASAGVSFFDLAANRVLPAAADPYADIREVRFLTDGRVVAAVGEGSGRPARWLAWDPAGGPPATIEGRGPAAAWGWSLSPDGRRYALAGSNGLEMADAASHRRLATGAVTKGRAGAQYAVTFLWSPDGEAVAATAGPTTVVLSAATGLARFDPAFLGFPGGPAFRTAAGERRRLGVAWDKGTCVLATSDERGGNPKTVRVPDFTPHGDLTSSGRVAGRRPLPNERSSYRTMPQVRSAEDGSVLWETDLGRTESWFVGPALAPDGRTVAIGVSAPGYDNGGAGTIDFFEVYTGGLRRRIECECEARDLAYDGRGRTLASGHLTAPIFLWDVYGERTDRRPPPTAADLDKAWADLASPDAAAGFRAVQLLVQHPAEAVPALKAKAAAEPRLSAEDAKARIGQLDSPHYPEREAAEHALAFAADDHLDLLKAAAQASTRPEAKARLERLIGNAGRPTPLNIRAVRAVEALEAAHTTGAKALLAAWAAGPPTRLLTREAVATLDRW